MLAFGNIAPRSMLFAVFSPPCESRTETTIGTKKRGRFRTASTCPHRRKTASPQGIVGPERSPRRPDVRAATDPVR